MFLIVCLKSKKVKLFFYNLNLVRLCEKYRAPEEIVLLSVY